MENFTCGLPISVIITDENNILALVTNDMLYEIKHEQYITECFGLYYFKFETPILKEDITIDSINVADFGLLLPKLTGNDDLEEMSVNGTYTVVTMEWQQINRDGKFSIQHYVHSG